MIHTTAPAPAPARTTTTSPTHHRSKSSIRRSGRNRPQESFTRPHRPSDYIPRPVDSATVRVIPLGGVEEVGRNMCAVEVGNDIFVVDAGFQFVSEDTNPGVDYLLPNTTYLEQNAGRVRAVLITHGHLDHIGAIPFLMSRFGNPPIYTQNLTSVMIQKRQEEYPDVPRPNIIVVEDHSRHAIGSTHVQFFPVTHSIPGAMGIVIETPYGNVIFTGDLKLDHTGGVPAAHEVKKWGELGAQNNLLFIADSTNAEQDGFSIPEQRVKENLEEIMRTVSGRLFIGVISTQFERMINIIQAMERLGKKVVTEGRSIRTNIEIAQKTGLLSIAPGTLISAQEMADYPPDKVVVLTTGAQGEEFGALMRIATKRHKLITFTSRDTVVLSSSVIPGNERSVRALKDYLYRYGVTLIHYRSSDVHSTGHGNTGELVWINQQVGAKFFMPAYGYYSMTFSHAKAIEQAGRPRDSIILADNGMVIDIIDGERIDIHDRKVPSEPLVVDGFSIGDRQELVIRDRQILAKEGVLVIVGMVDMRSGRLRKSPDIVSRGFVYLRESQELLHQTRIVTKQIIENSPMRSASPVDLEHMRSEVSEGVSDFLFQRTNKSPIVTTVLIGV